MPTTTETVICSITGHDITATSPAAQTIVGLAVDHITEVVGDLFDPITVATLDGISMVIESCLLFDSVTARTWVADVFRATHA